MLGTGILRLALQLAAIATGDTARIAGDRLIVEPLGFSIEIPALWLGKPGPPNQVSCDHGGTAQVEFWSRRIRNRRVTLVFMYTPYVEDQRAMLRSILQSVRF